MSLVGKKVLFNNYSVLGIVVDKYIGKKLVDQGYPSIHGGVISVKQYINFEYYIIDVGGNFIHIECSQVNSLENLEGNEWS